MNSVQPRAGVPTGPQPSSAYSSNPSSPPTTNKSTGNPSSFHSMSPALMSSTATTPSAFSSGNQAEAKSQYGSKGPSSVDGQITTADNQTPYPSVLIRRLPANMSREALTSMLLFAEDFVDAQFTALSIPEDKGFQSALARFRSSEGAQEVRQRLNGKSNAATTGMPMIVDVLQTGIDQGSDGNRKSSDPSQARKLSASASSAGSGGSVNGRSSRYNSTFRSLERISPPNLTHGTSGSNDFGEPAASNPAMFSPQSPAAKAFFDRSRISGKSVIADDLVDDETGELLKDPVAYAKGSQPHGQGNPISRFANLSLNTATANALGQHGQLPSARGIAGLHSPTSEFSPTSINAALNPTSPTSNYPMSPSSFEGRHHYPPANPADQNPPCNTLYVGNLPIDTSEDELKAIFSKQRGYKRLCFRTKHNGPMCFVEFEDISFATKALNELYGYPLHNSVKGGIRLSFSKNPLGVRAGQANGLGGPQSPMSPNGMSAISGFNGGPAFSTVSGPPPGLGMPPQQSTMMSPPMSNGSMSAGPATTTFFGSGSSPPMQQGFPAGHRTSGGPMGYPGAMSPLGSHFSDQPLGRS